MTIEESIMDTKHAVYRLLQLALIEIRHEAQTGGDPRNIAALADLFHNVPLRLTQDGVDHERVIKDLKAHAAGNAGLTTWLENNTTEG
jgi:hypothetical protein